MTPLEKKNELIEKFLDYVKTERRPKPNGYYNATQCAIIAVEEIIRVCRGIYFEHMDKEASKQCDYYSEVLTLLKKEME